MSEESEAYLHGLSARRSASRSTDVVTPSPTVSAPASSLTSIPKRHRDVLSPQDVATNPRISSQNTAQETDEPTPEPAPSTSQTSTPTLPTRKRSIAKIDDHLTSTSLNESILRPQAYRTIIDLSQHTAEQTRSSSDSSWIFTNGQGSRIELHFPGSFLRELRGETMEAITSKDRVLKRSKRMTQSTITPLGHTVLPLPARLGPVSSQADGKQNPLKAFISPPWHEDS
jgi:hypothetical protein